MTRLYRPIKYTEKLSPVLLKAFEARRLELGQTVKEALMASGIPRSTHDYMKRGHATQDLVMRYVKYCGLNSIRDLTDKYK